MILSDMQYHDPEHKFEKSFWGDCTNTLLEEIKQLEYAKRMGLMIEDGLRINAGGKNIMDIGGGPVSLLLKCINKGQYCAVIDPIVYPRWTYARYGAGNINKMDLDGEKVGQYFNEDSFDEVWIYNVLQHCMYPKMIIDNAKKVAPILRIFEWIDFEPHPGHPHMLKEELLNTWVSGVGQTEDMNVNGCYGHAYYGVFTR